MAQEAIFAEGISVFQPRETAPDFVLGEVVVDVNQFVNWVKQNQTYLGNDKKLRLNLKRSQNGKPYMDVNTYKPQPKQQAVAQESDSIFDL
jgi:hypothetical protein